MHNFLVKGKASLSTISQMVYLCSQIPQRVIVTWPTTLNKKRHAQKSPQQIALKEAQTYHNFYSCNARIAAPIPVLFCGYRPVWTADRKTVQLALLLDVHWMPFIFALKPLFNNSQKWWRWLKWFRNGGLHHPVKGMH